MLQALPQGVDLTDIDTTQKFDLGTLYEDKINNKRYRYVQNSSGSALAFVVGNSALEMAATAGIASTDRSEAAQTERCSGIALSAVTVGAFGWVQTKGRNLTCTTNGDNDMVVGDHAIVDAAADGDLNGIALALALTDVPVGRVIVAEAAAVVGLDLTLDW